MKDSRNGREVVACRDGKACREDEPMRWGESVLMMKSWLAWLAIAALAAAIPGIPKIRGWDRAH